MEIVWLGHSCFRIRGREATIVTDPVRRPPATASASRRRTSSPSATRTTITLREGRGRHAHVIDGPGEYEIHGAFITGISTFHDAEKGAERGRNLCFILEMEDIKVCHLGDLGHAPTAEQAEGITGADVLLVPIGGTSTIDGARAAEIVSC
jgi:L-ascorbate metabolism protein UlaG (beta-lactamase superfamily)